MATLDIAVEQPIQTYKEMTFELSNRQNSEYIRKGQEGRTNPQRLNSPKDYFLPMTSRVWDAKLKRYLKTQYVIGANTIYIDDRSVVNEAGKLEVGKGLKSQGYDLNDELRRAKDLGVKFTSGILFLNKYGGDPILAEYVHTHEDNHERPHADQRDTRKFTLFNFRPLKKEEKATKRIIDIEAQVDAMNYISKLRKKTAQGYEYNTELINVLLNIFDEGKGLKDDENAQKAEILFMMAQKNGAAFLSIINDTLDQYRVNIGKATSFSILNISAKQVKMTIGTKSRVILEFKKEENEMERMDKLCFHFIGSPTGVHDYQEMQGQIDIDIVSATKK